MKTSVKTNRKAQQKKNAFNSVIQVPRSVGYKLKKKVAEDEQKK